MLEYVFKGRPRSNASIADDYAGKIGIFLLFVFLSQFQFWLLASDSSSDREARRRPRNIPGTYNFLVSVLIFVEKGSRLIHAFLFTLVKYPKCRCTFDAKNMFHFVLTT